MNRLYIFFICLCLGVNAYAFKPAYIVDTDMGFDDWLAVLVAVTDKQIDLKGVAIDCQGETYCPAGVENARKLLFLAKSSTPIWLGATRHKTQYDFPKPIRDYASAMRVPGYLHLKDQGLKTTLVAKKAIATALIQAAHHNQKISIISIGTATNIADAYQYAVSIHQETAFRQGLKMIYKGGGAFGQVFKGQVTNKKIPGNISIPGMLTSENTAAEWNIYANAPAMQVLLSAKLPITFIPNNATDAVPMSWTIYRRFKSLANKNNIAGFTASAMQTLYALQHTWIGLNFWDTAVTLAALHPSMVSRRLFAVVRTGLTGRYVGATLVTTRGAPVIIDYKINKRLFYQVLFLSLK